MDNTPSLTKMITDRLDLTGCDPQERDLQELLTAIERRVDQLISNQPELLFSYLYRLDVSEQQVNTILRSTRPDKTTALARLILERQIARNKTKTNLPQSPIQGWQW